MLILILRVEWTCPRNSFAVYVRMNKAVKTCIICGFTYDELREMRMHICTKHDTDRKVIKEANNDDSLDNGEDKTPIFDELFEPCMSSTINEDDEMEAFLLAVQNEEGDDETTFDISDDALVKLGEDDDYFPNYNNVSQGSLNNNNNDDPTDIKTELANLMGKIKSLEREQKAKDEAIAEMKSDINNLRIELTTRINTLEHDVEKKESRIKYLEHEVNSKTDGGGSLIEISVVSIEESTKEIKKKDVDREEGAMNVKTDPQTLTQLKEHKPSDHSHPIGQDEIISECQSIPYPRPTHALPPDRGPVYHANHEQQGAVHGQQGNEYRHLRLQQGQGWHQ